MFEAALDAEHLGKVMEERFVQFFFGGRAKGRDVVGDFDVGVDFFEVGRDEGGGADEGDFCAVTPQLKSGDGC